MNLYVTLCKSLITEIRIEPLFNWLCTNQVWQNPTLSNLCHWSTSTLDVKCAKKHQAKMTQTTNGHRRQSGKKRKGYVSRVSNFLKLSQNYKTQGDWCNPAGTKKCHYATYVYAHAEKFTEGTHFPHPRPIPDLRLPSVHLDSPHLKLEASEAAKHSQSMCLNFWTNKIRTSQSV